jgi:hypothetical protein
LFILLFILYFACYKESLAKIIRQNEKIISKLDALNERVLKIEEACNKNNNNNNNNNVNPEFIQVRFHNVNEKFNKKLYVGLCILLLIIIYTLFIENNEGNCGSIN